MLVPFCQSPQLHRVRAIISLGVVVTTAVIGSAADYPLVPVPFNEVELTDTFWRPRLEIQRETLVPFALDQTRVGVAHLQAAADFLTGKEVKGFAAHRFVDSDLYKVIEGAAYLLKLKRDPALEARLDEIIRIIAAAQEPDGYLYPSHTTKVGTAKDMMGDRPYSYEVHSHELYNIGHLYEAAVAYHQATGKDNLLQVAEKSAQHVNRVFFVGDARYNDGKPVMQAPGHEEIELALVKLSRATGNPLYLEMARRFLEIRGVTYRPEGEGVMAPTYGQQHAPVKDQREALGHAVRAAYLYAGMADVSALTNDPSYLPALEAIWRDITNTRMHLTGGLGAVHGIEGFGPPFDLPNADAFNETCAAVGNVLFNFRMFLLQGDAKYLDVAEVALFNNVLAGVNLEGNRFFYINPLEADGRRSFNHGTPGRAAWFDTACCPTNLARLVPQVPGMLYAHRNRDVYVALYAASHTRVQLPDVAVDLKQASDYPQDGRIVLQVSPERSTRFRLHLRIPTWVGEQFVPGKLYHYADRGGGKVTLLVNSAPVELRVERGFAVIEREWRRGDLVELNLPMPVRPSVCRPEVKANLNRLAFTRGPFVLCAEGVDNAGAVQRFFWDTMPDSDQVESARTDGTGFSDIPRFTLPAKALTADAEVQPARVTLLPYYAWNNRGNSSMIVWFPRDRSQAIFDPTALPRDSVFKEVRASTTHEENGTVLAVTDHLEPSSSADDKIPRWTNWPRQGEAQWIEGTFTGPRPVRSIGVYWYDDGKYVRLPASWSVEVKKNGAWTPFRLYVTDQYSLRKDQYNVVHPAEPLVCDAIRVNMNLAPDQRFTGILELSVQFEPE